MNRESIKSLAFWFGLAFLMGFIVYQTVNLTNQRIEDLHDSLNLALESRAKTLDTLRDIRFEIEQIKEETNLSQLGWKSAEDAISTRVREVEKRVKDLEGPVMEELEPEVIDEHYSPTVPHGIGPPHS